MTLESLPGLPEEIKKEQSFVNFDGTKLRVTPEKQGRKRDSTVIVTVEVPSPSRTALPRGRWLGSASRPEAHDAGRVMAAALAPRKVPSGEAAVPPPRAAERTRPGRSTLVVVSRSGRKRRVGHGSLRVESGSSPLPGASRGPERAFLCLGPARTLSSC